jgi:hypothetical protein
LEWSTGDRYKMKGTYTTWNDERITDERWTDGQMTNAQMSH